VSIYEEKGSVANSEEGFMYDVVMNLIKGLDHKWHTICMDNLFSSPRLFHDMLLRGFWATGTLRANRIGVPKVISEKRGELDKRGSLLIKMHKHRQMLSTKQDAWQPNCSVVQKERGRRLAMVVPSSPVQQEYEEFMRGIDVTDHYRGLYTIQLRCHKWWIKVFAFVFDQSLVNMPIMYRERCLEVGQKPLSHMMFNIVIADHLVAPQVAARQLSRALKKVATACKKVHGPHASSLYQKCVNCGKRVNKYCPGCNYSWMCALECYTGWHKRPSFRY
jgi:hypothetical protein